MELIKQISPNYSENPRITFQWTDQEGTLPCKSSWFQMGSSHSQSQSVCNLSTYKSQSKYMIIRQLQKSWVHCLSTWFLITSKIYKMKLYSLHYHKITYQSPRRICKMILFFLFHHMKKNDSYMLKHFVHKFCKFFKTDQEYIDDPVIG